MNYASLLSAVESEMNRGSLSSDFPQFIELAEAEINARLIQNPVRMMHTRSTATIDAEYVTYPANMLDVTSITVPDYWRLDYVSPANFDKLLETESTYRDDLSELAAGVNPPPRYYTLIGNAFRFFPEPQTAHTADLVYWGKVPNLNNTDDENWVLTNHLPVYFHGILAFAYKKYYDREAADVEATLFSGAIDAMIATYPHRPDHMPLRSDVSQRDLKQRFGWYQ